MARLNMVYGIGQALIPSLPPPIGFENPPTSTQSNFEIGQVVFTPPNNPTAFYLYAGAGNWIQYTSSSGNILAIAGTANQIAESTTAGTATLSLPSAVTAPGSLATTTTLTGGTGVTSTTGNITATNGNLVLGTAGNKLSIATGSNASCGVSGAMSGSPGAVTVATTACTASSVILYSRATTGGTPGEVSITAQSTTGFTLTSTGNETSTFKWLIIN